MTINHVTEGLFENDGRKQKKPIVNFVEPDVKGLVCNKTNFMVIAEICGQDTKDWTGKQIEIYPDMVAFRGKVSESVRVRSVPKSNGPVTVTSAQPLPPKPASGVHPDLNDALPFGV